MGDLRLLALLSGKAWSHSKPFGAANLELRASGSRGGRMLRYTEAKWTAERRDLSRFAF